MPEGDRKGKSSKSDPKGLGDDEFISASDWVKKSRAISTTEKTVHQLNYDEQDTLLEQQDAVAANLQVMHAPDAFAEGTEHILHLKDAPVLDEKGRELNMDDDALENPDMLEEERRKFKQKSTKKAYNVYADLEGEVKTILPQYDDENLEFKRTGFKLDAQGDKDSETDLQTIRSKLQESLGTIKAEMKSEGKVQYTLDPFEFGIKVQSEYQTPAEAAKFKKVKKVEKPSRKKLFDLVAQLEAEAVEDNGANHSSRQISLKAERDTERAMQALAAKERAYRLAKQKAEEARAAVKELAKAALKEDEQDDDASGRIENEDENGNIVFDPTEEFAKNLATDEDFFSRQRRRQEFIANRRQEKEADASGWTETTAEEEEEEQRKADNEEDVDALLDQHRRNLEDVQAFYEPKAGGSLADALKLIQQKGWITAEFSGRQNDRVVDLRVNDPAPQISIERKDETGREMTQKEAFRRLSHKFHGKAPGKLKQEKKIKRFKEEKMLTGMDATDTPLGSLKALQNAQQVTRSPFIVVQGGGTDHMGLTPLLSKKDKRKSDDQLGGSESTLAKRIRA